MKKGVPITIDLKPFMWFPILFVTCSSASAKDPFAHLNLPSGSYPCLYQINSITYQQGGGLWKTLAMGPDPLLTPEAHDTCVQKLLKRNPNVDVDAHKRFHSFLWEESGNAEKVRKYGTYAKALEAEAEERKKETRQREAEERQKEANDLATRLLAGGMEPDQIKVTLKTLKLPYDQIPKKSDVARSTYFAQVASFKSLSEAEMSLNKFKDPNGLTPEIKTISTDTNYPYKVVFGGYLGRAKASEVCRYLKKGGQDCFVVSWEKLQQ